VNRSEGSPCGGKKRSSVLSTIPLKLSFHGKSPAPEVWVLHGIPQRELRVTIPYDRSGSSGGGNWLVDVVISSSVTRGDCHSGLVC